MSNTLNSSEKASDSKRSKIRRSATVPARLSEHDSNGARADQVDQSSVPENDKSAIKNRKESTQSIQENGAKINSESLKAGVTDEARTPEASPAKSSSLSVTSPDVKASLAERARQLARQFGNKNQKETTQDNAMTADGTPDGAKTTESTPDEAKTTESTPIGAKTTESTPDGVKIAEDTTPAKSSLVGETSPEKKASLAERAKQIAKQLVSKAKDGSGSTHHHSPGRSPGGRSRHHSTGKSPGDGSSSRKIGESSVEKKRKKKKNKKRDASK